MFEVFISNSVHFLNALSDWLVDPLPLSLLGLGLIVFVFSLFRGRFL